MWQHKKTPTERLLDVFGSPIPSEIEDAEVPMETREYQTTEDEDDAIDGLLALGNASRPKPSLKTQTETGISKTNSGVNENTTSKHKDVKKRRTKKAKELKQEKKGK